MKPENPSEPFKRAVATAVRSLAGEPELEVTFSAEPPALRGPEGAPAAALAQSAAERSRRRARRGRRLCAAPRLSRRQDPRSVPPQSAEAAAVFEAAEQARVEAIGALAMKGVAHNLAAGLEQRLHARGLAKARVQGGSADRRCAGPDGAREADRRSAAGMRCSCGRSVAALHRRERRRDLEKLGAALRDQKAFAKLTRTILQDLKLGDDFDADEASDDAGEGENADNQEQDGEEQDARANRSRAKPTCRNPRAKKATKTPPKCAPSRPTSCPTPRSPKTA